MSAIARTMPCASMAAICAAASSAKAAISASRSAAASIPSSRKCRLTHSHAPRAVMHGFLNVFIAAALSQFATQILLEENPRAFAFDDGGLWWHDLRVTSEELVRLREQFAISFGSCSFEEPIADLKESGWL